MMPQIGRFAIVLLAAAPTLGGCQKVSVWLTQIQNPQASQPGAASSPAASLSPEQQAEADRSAKSRANAELLQELYRVVLVVNPKSPADFGNWLDSLNQGASLEGVYRGFSRSHFQISLESDKRTTATPRAVGVFSNELADLLLEFRVVPEVMAEDARALQAIAPPGSEEELRGARVRYDEPRQIVFKPLASPAPSEGRARPERSALVGRVGATFAGSSIFTMKRVLCDWALKLIDQKLEESSELFRDWYADFAVRYSKKGVDFGLGLRNDSAREFHRKWAAQATDDQIRWEVLNRLHRILNDAQGMGTAPAASSSPAAN